ncbi:acyltransferase family protein [Rhodopseudomonas palustris]|uniref:Acyltransferase 3 n=1 Tax=Rhodopseudomonas palustris (strain BisB18) TaxID=316056 RepID=Q20YG9_RHOPB
MDGVAPVVPIPHNSQLEARTRGFDALRGSLTLLVLFHHAAITYGAPGGWFYREISPNDSPSSQLLMLFVTVNQSYFMGVFFLLAGYFTPGALRHKGARRFVRDRLWRLGLPLLVFGVLLGPLTVALAWTSKGWPVLPSLISIWRSGTFIPGPLWFAEALLLFGFAAVLWHLLLRRRSGAVAVSKAFPSNRTLAIAAIATGATSFAIRLWWPVGTAFAGLQFGYFAGYAVLFAAGCIAAEQRWLERIPPESVRLWSRVTLLCLPILPAVVYLGAAVPALQESPEGGLNPLAMLYAFWEPLVAWGIMLWLLTVYQRRFPRLDGLWRSLAARAYTIYIIHPPVLVGVALAWRETAAPLLVKFAITGLVSCAICFSSAGLILRIPGARRIL